MPVESWPARPGLRSRFIGPERRDRLYTLCLIEVIEAEDLGLALALSFAKQKVEFGRTRVTQRRHGYDLHVGGDAPR